MAVTVKQTEAAPDAYPDVPGGLSDAALALDSDMLWQRIESYIAHRWTARSVVWVVEGPGEWHPPLTPATISTIEIWNSADSWESITPNASPLGGYWLSGCGPYRFTANVGSGSVPAAVNEAFRRLAEDAAAKRGKPGATSERVDAGSISVSVSRDAEWMARALQNSGAADLLRKYRRA